MSVAFRLKRDTGSNLRFPTRTRAAAKSFEGAAGVGADGHNGPNVVNVNYYAYAFIVATHTFVFRVFFASSLKTRASQK